MGAARPQEASFREAHSGGRSSSSRAPQPCLRANHSAGTIRDSPARMPGMMPPMNSAGMDTPGTMTA